MQTKDETILFSPRRGTESITGSEDVSQEGYLGSGPSQERSDRVGPVVKDLGAAVDTKKWSGDLGEFVTCGLPKHSLKTKHGDWK